MGRPPYEKAKDVTSNTLDSEIQLIGTSVHGCNRHSSSHYTERLVKINDVVRYRRAAMAQRGAVEWSAAGDRSIIERFIAIDECGKACLER